MKIFMDTCDVEISTRVFLPPLECNQIQKILLNFPKEYYNDVNCMYDTHPFLAFLVAYLKENGSLEPIGFLEFSLLYEKIEIDQFYVLPSYRNRGIGKFLLEELNKIAIEKKCNSITLEVNMKNEVALSLYKKLGFQMVTIRKNYYFNREDAYLLLKEVGVKE